MTAVSDQVHAYDGRVQFVMADRVGDLVHMDGRYGATELSKAFYVDQGVGVVKLWW